MSGGLLILNAGSSSLKFSLYDSDGEPEALSLLCEGQYAGFGHAVRWEVADAARRPLADAVLPAGSEHEQALEHLLPWLAAAFPAAPLRAAVHRVVHGGPRFHAPVRIDAEVITEIERLVPLAPLHQPHHLSAIRALAALDAALPQVACFDTAFHHGQEALATAFALPRALAADGVRRYGFHGLSYEYIASRLEAVCGPEVARGRVVVAHLGSGASLCAMHDRRSVATTMGFTALDGLPMGRRCGALDPGVVLYLQQQRGFSVDQVADLLYHDSGLLGVSGVSDDMRELLASPAPAAAEAVELFCYRVGRELGSLAAALGGLDALVFTAGIGEHAPAVRARIARRAAWLGVEIDAAANEAGRAGLSAPGARVSTWVVPTDEDLMMARHGWRVLHGGG